VATRPSVAEALALSDDQKTTLARTLADHKAHRDPAPEAEQRLNARILATLSDGQKLRWERMLGRPFSPRATASATPPAAR